ncbi:MAG: CpaF family protein [Caldilineaceae bacterium]
MNEINRKWAPLTQAVQRQPHIHAGLMDPQTADLARQWQEKFLQSVNLDEFIRMEPTLRRTKIENKLNELISADANKLPYGQYNQIVTYILNEALGYGPLASLVTDPSISEIMVNGPNTIYIERGGRVIQIFDVRFQDEQHLRNIVDRIVSRVGRRIDEASPMVDARLEDGSRVNVMIPPLSLDGPLLTIRKFQRNPFSLDDLVKIGTLTEPMAQFLEACVRARLSILVAGGTGAGKTTLLNALASWIGREERVITVEDSAELKFHQQHPHVVRAETRPANMQGAGQVTIRDLVRNALRMRPDRIVVGEVRGAEALDMLQAMNTGHEGSMTTVHANSPEDALRRLETMVMWAEGASALPLSAIREQIVSAIDIIVQIVRHPNGRRVSAISEVKELRRGEIVVKDIFRFDVFETDASTGHVRGRFDATGVKPAKLAALKTKGIKNLEEQMFIPSHFESRFGEILRDDSITEIMINGLEDTRVERRNQGIVPVNLFFQSEAHLLSAINSIIAPLGKRLDARHPTVDARLPDGSRVNVVVPPVSLNGPVVTIRRFPKEPLRPDDLVEGGSLTDEMMEFLRACVQAKFNILISGGTGSGKTTLLNALSAFIAEPSGATYLPARDERIITIEDVAELQIQHDHWIRLEARSADEFGEGQVTIRDLVVNALRMRPDRIIVGEVRGAEALDMLQAMNTGHEGSMTTIHANSPEDAFYRLETMVAWSGSELPSHTVRAQIVGALDIIVQVNRLPNGKRRVTQIAEVLKADRKSLAVADIFVHRLAPDGAEAEDAVEHHCVNPQPHCAARLNARGIKLDFLSTAPG